MVRWVELYMDSTVKNSELNELAIERQVGDAKRTAHIVYPCTTPRRSVVYGCRVPQVGVVC